MAPFFRIDGKMHNISQSKKKTKQKSLYGNAHHLLAQEEEEVYMLSPGEQKMCHTLDVSGLWYTPLSCDGQFYGLV